MWEFSRDLSAHLRKEGKLMMSNQYGEKFFYPFMDMFGMECSGGSQGLDGYNYPRTMAYQKPVSWLDYWLIRSKDGPAGFDRETAMNYCLLMGIFPGTADFIEKNKANFEAVRPVYKKYIPLITETSEAGWQPMTHARSAQNVLVERFGDLRQRGVVYFTVMANRAFKRDSADLAIDASELGIKPAMRLIVGELTENKLISLSKPVSGEVTAHVAFAGPNRTSVIRIATPEALTRIYVRQAAEHARRVAAQMKWTMELPASNEVKSALRERLPTITPVVQKLDRAASGDRPRNLKTLTGLRSDAADLARSIRDLPQSFVAKEICLAQCSATVDRLEKALTIVSK
jgi:hypothetical protein